MNKKKKSNILNIFGFILALGGLGMAGYGAYDLITTEDKGSYLCYILLGCGVVALVLGIVMLANGRKIKKDICLKCGEPLQLCAYEWVLETLHNEVSSNMNDDRYYSKEMARYKITATCNKCGKERIFYKEFMSYDYRTRTENNVTRLIEDWCKQKFGH